MPTLKNLRTWRNDLTLDVGDDAERAQRAERRRVMDLSASTDTYLTGIDEVFAELDLIPGAYEEPADIAQAIDKAAGDHDGWGGLLFDTAQAQQNHPQLTAAQKQDILDAARAFVPTRKDLVRAYAVEAQNARDREAALAIHGPVLATVPIVGGTCLDAARNYVDAGKRLGDGLARRVLNEASGSGDRSAVAALRAALVHRITRWRTAVEDEIHIRKRLPANAVELIFGYLDRLASS